MADRLLSPNGRRIARKSDLGVNGVGQLLKFGWTDYDGPAQATYSKHSPALSGWVVRGSDERVDLQRLNETGTVELGNTTGTHDLV